jgi:hypothetical protein
MDFADIPNNYVTKVRNTLFLSNSGTTSYEL